MSNDNHTQGGQSPQEPASPPEQPTETFQAPSPEQPTQTFSQLPNPGGRTLSNGIAFAAVGLMAIVASLGLLVFFVGAGRPLSGRAILISVGIIVLTAGGVLIYAALKGQRAGWFLPFTIVGALIAVPVGAIGAGMHAYEPYFGSYAEEVWVDESWSDQEWSEEATSEDGGWAFTDSDAPVRQLGPADSAIIGNGERLVLNLTEIEDVHDLAYQVSLDSSELVVLLTDDQLPLVSQWNVDDSSLLDGQQLAGFYNDDSDFAWQMQQWIDSGFIPTNYPFGLGYPDADPDATFTFNVTLNNGSVLTFAVVDEAVWGHWSNPGTQGPATDHSPQSGATQHEQDSNHNTDGGN